MITRRGFLAGLGIGASGLLFLRARHLYGRLPTTSVPGTDERPPVALRGQHVCPQVYLGQTNGVYYYQGLLSPGCTETVTTSSTTLFQCPVTCTASGTNCIDMGAGRVLPAVAAEACAFALPAEVEKFHVFSIDDELNPFEHRFRFSAAGRASVVRQQDIQYAVRGAPHFARVYKVCRGNHKLCIGMPYCASPAASSAKCVHYDRQGCLDLILDDESEVYYVFRSTDG